MLSIEQFMREYKYFEHLGPVPFCTFVQMVPVLFCIVGKSSSRRTFYTIKMAKIIDFKGKMW